MRAAATLVCAWLAVVGLAISSYHKTQTINSLLTTVASMQATIDVQKQTIDTQKQTLYQASAQLDKDREAMNASTKVVEESTATLRRARIRIAEDEVLIGAPNVPKP